MYIDEYKYGLYTSFAVFIFIQINLFKVVEVVEVNAVVGVVEIFEVLLKKENS